MGYKIGLREKRKKEIEENLKKIIHKIIESEVEKIILFGSVAENMVSKSSDIDIIIVKKTVKKFLERLDEMYKIISPDIAIDLIVYTPEEYERLKETNSFLKSALKRGKILYEKKE